MAKKVVLSPTATQKLEELLRYLQQEWSENVKLGFVEKFDAKIKQVAKFPWSCPESQLFKGLHKCVVTKQNTFYYRIKGDEIEVVTLFDTRQDTAGLKP